MARSILWYDYETTGIDVRRDRPLQVAALRTDEDLNEIAAPTNLYCRLSDDILPHPAACLITGITPQQLQQQGLGEAEFMQRLHTQMAQPGTCTAGYNTLRFDDEMTRYSLWRNFYDPYTREWQNGNSRWDLIDLVRCAYALRPHGIEWPEENGRVSLKLELLCAANGISHDKAHDALSDVRATIALARCIKKCQPKLYDWLYRLRSKQQVEQQIRLLQPLLHVSGRFSAERHYISLVLPLAWHPQNRNMLIVYDLHHEVSPLLQEDAKVLKKRLYTKRSDLAEGQLPVALKGVRINRCPVLAPLSALRAQDKERLQWDLPLYQQRAEELVQTQELWQEKLRLLYATEDFDESTDPEQQLYGGGFLSPADRRLCEQVKNTGSLDGQFIDARLPELFFRYRARNFAQDLSAEEKQRWYLFCQNRLTDSQYGAPNTVADFRKAILQALPQADDSQRECLGQWQQYADTLAVRYAL